MLDQSRTGQVVIVVFNLLVCFDLVVSTKGLGLIKDKCVLCKGVMKCSPYSRAL